MKYFHNFDINTRADGVGIEIVVGLNQRWKERASQISKEVVERIFRTKQDLCFQLEVSVSPKFDNKGLFTGIDFSPDRAGLDLQGDKYLSHNIDNSRQSTIVIAIMHEYLKALEYFGRN